MTNLERWRFALTNCESNLLLIDWAFYGMLSAALERRVAYDCWPTLATPTTLFSNIYLVFIGPPGCGKSMPMSMAKAVFRHFGGLESKDDYLKSIINIAPNSVSVEALWSRMATVTKVTRLDAATYAEAFPAHVRNEDGTPKGKEYLYLSTPMAVIADQELGTFLPEYASSIVNFLQEAYVATDFEDLKVSAGSRFLKSVCLTLLGCSNPEWIIQAQKNKLLAQGLSARTIFVYAEHKRQRVPHFKMTPEQQAAYLEVAQHVKQLTRLFGKCTPSAEAKAFFDDWYLQGGDAPINKAEVLTDYYTRKRVHVLKVAMLMHFADATSFTLERSDFERAIALLAQTERNMHKALSGSGINPVYDIADRIVNKLLANNGVGIPSVNLLASCFPYCPSGRADFDAAIEFLLVTNQIEGPFCDERQRPFFRSVQQIKED